MKVKKRKIEVLIKGKWYPINAKWAAKLFVEHQKIRIV